MRIGVRLIIFCTVVAILSLGLISCKGAPAAPSSPAPVASSAQVEISGFAFKPDTVTIGAGGTVTWTNKDSTTHTVTSDSGAFNSGNFGPNGTYSFTFKDKGTFSYHCVIHSSMKGKVIVQ